MIRVGDNVIACRKKRHFSSSMHRQPSLPGESTFQKEILIHYLKSNFHGIDHNPKYFFSLKNILVGYFNEIENQLLKIQCFGLKHDT